MDILCQNDVVSTSMRRNHVASTLIRRHFHVMCPLGTLSRETTLLYPFYPFSVGVSCYRKELPPQEQFVSLKKRHQFGIIVERQHFGRIVEGRHFGRVRCLRKLNGRRISCFHLKKWPYLNTDKCHGAAARFITLSQLHAATRKSFFFFCNNMQYFRSVT